MSGPHKPGESQKKKCGEREALGCWRTRREEKERQGERPKKIITPYRSLTFVKIPHIAKLCSGTTLTMMQPLVGAIRLTSRFPRPLCALKWLLSSLLRFSRSMQTLSTIPGTIRLQPNFLTNTFGRPKEPSL